MRLQCVLGLLSLIFIHPASSGVTVRTREILQEASGTSGEGETTEELESEIDSAEESGSSAFPTYKSETNNVEHVAMPMKDEKGIKRVLAAPNRGDSLYKVPRLLGSDAQESISVDKPAANIETEVVSEKPQTATSESHSEQKTSGTSASVAATSRIADQVKPLDQFDKDCLESHNSYRARHGVPPLMWSEELAEGAQKWADQLASNDVIQHDQEAMENGKLGENLAYFTPPTPKCERAVISNCVMCREMVQRWYNEIKNYDFDQGQSKSPKAPYKHFSQIVWANTAEIGVGTAVSKKFGFITVARYRPMGNQGGADEFVKNVPPDGGPLPIVDTSFADAPSLSREQVKPYTHASVTSSPKGDVSSPDTANTDTSSPASVHKAYHSKETGSEKVAPPKGFVHTVVAADGSQAQVYLSKKGDHAGIVFRNQISRGYPIKMFQEK